jgi:hypothetical protein
MAGFGSQVNSTGCPGGSCIPSPIRSACKDVRTRPLGRPGRAHATADIVALADTITLTDLQLRAFERMLEPKKLATVEGGHFDPYLEQFPRTSTAAISWFSQHLA